jgi:hypothetical protein
MRNITLAVAAATMAVPATFAIPTAPAEAQSRYYDRQGYYSGPTWRGTDGQVYCRRPNGTTGMVVGGAAGALIGREIAGRGDRTLGTIVGAAAGALVGREIQRSNSRVRCR